MNRKTFSRCPMRFGLIAAIAICLSIGFGPQLALADPASPLAVTKTATPSPVASGAELTYTISIVNTGGAKVDKVVMTDQLNGVGGIGVPPQLVLASTRGTCSQSALKVTCNVGTIPGGGSAIITIRGIVTAANGTTLNNTASVSGTKSAQNFTTTATVQTLVQNNNPSPLPDLTISKTGPSSVVQSAAMTYILTVNNTGNANATDIRVVDTLPAGVGFVSVNGTSLFVCSSAGSPVTVTCDGGRVNQGANATITINATAPAVTGNIANTAVVDPNNTIAESNELNNTSATVSTAVTSAPAPQGLTITKIDEPDPVVPGAILKYTIVVMNVATTRADDVVTVDGTQGLEAASITASQVIVNGAVGTFGGCVVEAPQVRCSIRSLNPGGTQTVTIQGQVVESAGSTILNTATATANIKNVGVSAHATAQTTVKPAVDLTITKADSPDPVCARSWPNGTHLTNPPEGLSAAGGTVPTLLATPGCLGGLTYSFVVGNSGIDPAGALNVVVRDPLPAGLIFDSYDADGGFTCAVDAANVITCSGGTVLPESTRTITFLLVAPPTVGEITNTVTVDPNNAIYESDETNNTFVQATAVSTGIDLVIQKDDSPTDPPGTQVVTDGFDPIATSGTLTYTITVDNVGTQDVTGIRVRDTLPEDTRFLSVISDPTHGFTCAHNGAATGGIVECIGGHLLGTESEFYDPAGPAQAGPGDDIATIKIKVFARHTVGAMHNEVRVDPDNEIAEYNELNNLETEDTTVTNGGINLNAYNELKIKKEQTSPVDGSDKPIAVATNGVITWTITVWNDATDPVGQSAPVVVKDTLPQGFRYIEARDTALGPDGFQCVQGANLQEVTCTAGGPLSGLVHAIAGVPVTRTITVKAFAANVPSGGGVVYTNQADVDPNNTIPEGDEFNNRASINTDVKVGGANMFNELTITKTQTTPASGVAVATSSFVTYTIVVANTGTDPAFDVAVKDTLPAGFTYVEATDTAPGPHAFVCTTAAGNVINCTGATLSGTVNQVSGQPTSRTIKLTAFSSAVPGLYTNTAIVDPDNTIAEGNETNNTAQATTKVVVGAGYIDLQIGKTGSAKVVPGGMITYTLSVTNTGTNPAFNVTVRDDLPAGTTFVSAVDTTAKTAPSGAFSCIQAGISVQCTGGTLDGTDNLIPGTPPDDVPTSRTIEIKVLAPYNIEALALDKGNISIDITNQAFIDPYNAIPESNETNNWSSATTTVKSKINLRIEKTGPDEAHQNDEGDYVIKVYNEDADGNGTTAFGVEVVDPLPVGLIPLSVKTEPTDASNFRCEIQENPVNRVYCIGDMGPKGYDTPPDPVPPDTHVVTITVHVFVTANGGPLDNEACVDPNHLISEQNETDNCVHKITQVVQPKPQLLINKTASSSFVTPGQELTYKVTVSNVGTAPASNVVITDALPSEVTLSTAIGANGYDCTGTTELECKGPAAMQPGEATDITVIVNVNEQDVTLPFTNSAGAKCDEITTPVVAKATVSVGGSGIDLQVASVTDSVDPVNPGEALEYTIVVVNNGTSSAGAPGDLAQVEIAWPQQGVHLVGVDGTNAFNCTQASPAICEGVFQGSGDAPNNETIITVRLTVDKPGMVPSLKLVATADPFHKFIELDKNNNTNFQETTVSNFVCSPNCIDLVMAQALGSPQPVLVGGTETYNVQLVNVGDTDTANGGGPPPTPRVSVNITVTGNIDVLPGVPTIVLTNGTDVFEPCTHPTNDPGKTVYTCTGNLSAGAGALFTFSVTATGPAPGSIKIDAKATLSGALQPDFNPANNEAKYTTNVYAP